MKPEVIIIDYGTGNVQSLKFALQRLGYQGKLSACASEVSRAEKIIFPGVGEASSAMKKLQDTGLDTLIPKLKTPVLGICLGMQLMCAYCEEGNTTGMGIFDIDVVEFKPVLKVPQMGWNQISNLKSLLFKGIEEREYVYLIHSFYAPICKETIAKTHYGISYSAALHKNNFYGVQFHPEKSSGTGERILRNFLELR